MKVNNLPEYIEVLDSRDKNCPLKTLRYNNKYIHSPYNPQKEAENELDKYSDINSYETIIIFGLGMGYLLDELIKRINNQTIKIVVIEYEQAFQAFVDLKKDSQVVFLFNQSIDKILNVLIKQLNNISIKKILFLGMKSLIDINPEYYKEIKNQLLIHLQQKVADITTTAYFSKQWLFNCFINFSFLNDYTFINDLKDIYKDNSGLFIASGPSIEKDIQEIRKFKGPIFTLPPSVNYLLKNDIVPDYIILGDSNYNNLYHLQKSMNKNIPLICDLSIHYTIMKKWLGPKIIISYHLPGLDFYYNKYNIEYIPQGGTASSTALTILNYLGINNVLLSGQDFAYHDFKLHIKGSGYEEYYKKRINKVHTLYNMHFNQIKDNEFEYQDNLIIDHKLKLYKDWFYKLVNYLKIEIKQFHDKLFVYQKKEQIVLKESLDLHEELKDLNNRLDDLTGTDDFDRIMGQLKKDQVMYQIIENFNFTEFLKIKQNLDFDEKNFVQSLLDSTKQIKWLIQYNLNREECC